MTPDPMMGRLLRALSIGLVAISAVLHVAW